MRHFLRPYLLVLCLWCIGTEALPTELRVLLMEENTPIENSEGLVIGGDPLLLRLEGTPLAADGTPLYNAVRFLNRDRHLGYGIWNRLTRSWELAIHAPQPEPGADGTTNSHVASADLNINNGGFEDWIDANTPRHWYFSTEASRATDVYRGSGHGGGYSLGLRRRTSGWYNHTFGGMVYLLWRHEIVPGAYYILSMRTRNLSNYPHAQLGFGNSYFKWGEVASESQDWESFGPAVFRAGRYGPSARKIVSSEDPNVSTGVTYLTPAFPTETVFSLAPHGKGTQDPDGSNDVSEWLVDDIELKEFSGMVLRAVFVSGSDETESTESIFVGVDRNPEIAWDAPPVIIDRLQESSRQLGFVDHEFKSRDQEDFLFDFDSATLAYSGTDEFFGSADNAQVRQAFAATFGANALDEVSPELRRHHILDELVEQLRHDPLLIVDFVLNEIELVDPLGHSVAAWGDPRWEAGTLYEGGIRRNALATYLTRHGSPTEQCALLVYLLRRAGFPAAFARAPEGNLKMRKQRVSNLIGHDLNQRTENEHERKILSDGVDANGDPKYITQTTNLRGYAEIELVPVDYPWVVFLIEGKWVHVFPWLKDYDTVVGLNLYDYLPFDLNSGKSIAVDYMLKGKYFEEFLQQYERPKPREVIGDFLDFIIRKNHPQLSLDDFGVRRKIRKRYRSDFSDLPRPDVLDGQIGLLARHLEAPNSFEWIEISLGEAILDSATEEYKLHPSFSPQLRVPLADLFMRRIWIDRGQDTPVLKIGPFDHHDQDAYSYQQQSGKFDFLVNGEWNPTYLSNAHKSLQWNILNVPRFKMIYLDVLLRSQPRIPLSPAETDGSQALDLKSWEHGGKYWYFPPLLGRAGKVISSRTKSDVIAFTLGNEAHPDVIDFYHREYAYRRHILGHAASDPEVSLAMTNDLMGRMYHRELTSANHWLYSLHGATLTKFFGYGLFGFQGESSGDSHFYPLIDYGWARLTRLGSDGFSTSLQSIVTDRSNSWREPPSAFRNWEVNLDHLWIILGSAAEHFVLNDIFGPIDVSSSISVFHKAGKENILRVNHTNFAELEANGIAAHIESHSPRLWKRVRKAKDDIWMDAYITLHPVQGNTLYDTALVSFYRGGLGAHISTSTGDTDPNGGGGEDVSSQVLSDILISGDVGAKEPDPSRQTAADLAQVGQVLALKADASQEQTAVTAAYQGAGAANADGAEDQEVRKFDDADGVGGDEATRGTHVADPVNSVTGEFYINTVDVRLEGTFPLELRRNYGSLSLVSDFFGRGWRSNLVPYLMVNSDNPNDLKGNFGKRIRSAEMDGTLVEYAFSHQDGSAYIWVVATEANASLSNQSVVGVGGRNSVFANRLVFEDSGSEMRFTLYGNAGDRRVFRWRNYQLFGVDYARPYLDSWEDANGNRLTFEYYDDFSVDLWQFGKPRRIIASNGNWLRFKYNRAGQIREASTGDGRVVRYSYDSFGDLRRVDLPDGSWEEYNYRIMNSWFTGSNLSQLGTRTDEYSSGLIRGIRKSDGSRLVNFFDDRRRVIAQQATVGSDTNLIPNAFYVYGEVDANGVGWTRIYDFREVPSAIQGEINFTDLEANGWPFAPSAVSLDTRCTLFEHRHGLVTRITDRMGDTIESDYYWERSTIRPNPGSVLPSAQGHLPDINQSIGVGDPGGYSRSLKRFKDKRGMITYYWYDANGNVILQKQFGDFTGDGNTSARIYRNYYNSNNLPVAIRDEASDSIIKIDYDGDYPFLPATRQIYLGGTVSGDPQSGYSVNGGTLMGLEHFHYNPRTVFDPAVTYVNGLVNRRTARDASDPSVPNKDRIIRKWEYDNRGLPLSHTRFATRGSGESEPQSPYDQRDLLTYNLRNELERRTREDGSMQRFRYDQAGRPISATVFENAESSVPLSSTYTYYDVGGRPTMTDGPQRGDAEDYVFRDYDAAGRLVAEVRWLSEAKEDGSGVRPLPDQDFLLGQALTVFEYDPFGNLRKIIDPLGHETVLEYDFNGRLSERSHRDGNTAKVLSTERFTYEPGGGVATHWNPLDGVTTNTYTADGQIASTTQPDGSLERRRYRLDGRVDYIIHPGGNRTKFLYNDAERKVTRQVLLVGTLAVLAQSHEIRDVHGNVVEKVDFNGHLWKYEYDGLNRVVREEGPADTHSARIVRTYEYDPAGKWQMAVTSGKEHVLEEFDGLGRPVRRTHRAPLTGQVPNKLAGVMGPVYSRTSWHYDPHHHWIMRIEGNDDLAAADVGISRAFVNTLGREVVVQKFIDHNAATGMRSFTLKDGNGADWTFGGAVTRNRYDLAGYLRERYVDIKAGSPVVTNRTAWRYDAMGRVIREELPDGAVTRFVYDPMGNLTERAMPRDLLWQARYDNLGRKTAEWLEGQDTAARTRHWEFAYYPNGHPHVGRLSHRIDRSRQLATELFYDNRGRLNQEVSEGSGDVWPVTRTWIYDSMGNPISTQEFNPGKEVDGWPEFTLIQRQYDAYGRARHEAVSRWTAEGWKTQALDQTWDDQGRRTSLVAPDGGLAYSREYLYDSTQNRHLRTDHVQLNGTTPYSTKFDHRGVARVRTNSLFSQTSLDVNHAGRHIRREVRFQGNPGFPGFANQQQVLDETIAHTLDGRLADYRAIYQPNGPSDPNRKYTYNARRQLTSETWRQSTPNGSQYTESYRFDGAKLGVLTEREVTIGSTYHSGWSVPGTGLDPFARVTGEAVDAAPLLAAGYTNGPARVRLELERLSAPAWTQPVGDVRQPESANDFHWESDLAGLSPGDYRLRAWAQHTSGAFVTGPAERTFTVTTQQSGDQILNAYDPQGFLRERHFDDGRTQHFEWDALGRVILLRERDLADDGRDFRFLYDGRGRRLVLRETPVVNGQPLPAQSLETCSWYDPQVAFLEIRVEQGAEKWWKVYGPDHSGAFGGVHGIGGLNGLAKVDGSERIHVMQDIHGHTIAYTRKEGTGSWTWGGFTEGRNVSGYGPSRGATVKPWRVGGGAGYESEFARTLIWRGYRIEAFGLYHLGARLYDPVSGRFLSPDPLEHTASLDLYSYANGDPVNFVDPTGELGIPNQKDGPATVVSIYVEGYFGSGAFLKGVAADLRSGNNSGFGGFLIEFTANVYSAVGAAITPQDFHENYNTTVDRIVAASSGSIDGGLVEQIVTVAAATVAEVIGTTNLVEAAAGVDVLGNQMGWSERLQLVAVGFAKLAGTVAGAKGLADSATPKAPSVAARNTETVQRAMSRAELEAIQSSGVLSRGGRAGPHHVSDAVNSTANRARQRLALPGTPEVRVTLEVPSGTFSPPSTVQPYRIPGTNQVLPGGGLERTAPGNIDIPARIIDVLDYTR